VEFILPQPPLKIVNSAVGLSRPPTRNTSPSTSVSHHYRHSSEAASNTPTVVPKREDPLDGSLYTMPLEHDTSPIPHAAHIPRETPAPSRRDSTDSAGLQNMMGGLDIERRASADSAVTVEGNKRREGEPSGDDRPSKRMRMSVGGEEVAEERVEKETEEGEVSEGNVVKEELVDQSLEHQRETSSATPPSPNIRRRGIGIHHMDLLYETKGNSMVCRICV
jgi:hypothetical protein